MLSIEPGNWALIAPKMVPRMLSHSIRENRNGNHFVLGIASGLPA